MSLRGHKQKYGNNHNEDYLMSSEVLVECDTFFVSRIATFSYPGSDNTSCLSTTVAEKYLIITAKLVIDKLISYIKNQVLFTNLNIDTSPDLPLLYSYHLCLNGSAVSDISTQYRQ